MIRRGARKRVTNETLSHIKSGNRNNPIKVNDFCYRDKLPSFCALYFFSKN